MVLRANSFLLALAIFLTNVCCLSAAKATATPPPVEQSSAHKCCPDSKPHQPAKPADRNCDCCKGRPTLHNDAVKNVTVDSTAMVFSPLLLVEAVSAATIIPVSSDLKGESSPPPTLLALHCALVI